MKKVALFLLAFVGLPLVWALVLTLLDGMAVGMSRETWFTSGTLGFFIGAGLMVLLYWKVARGLDTLYVFAHEMTHAVVGLCFFAKVHRVHVEAKKGFVQLSKENVFITLAPYCVPFYLLVAVGIYGILRLFIEEPLPFYLWTGFFGLLTAFHVLKTLDALLGVSQPDTHVYGRFFSYWFILCMNLFFASLALCLTRVVGWGEQFASLLGNVLDTYHATIDFFLSLVH